MNKYQWRCMALCIFLQVLAGGQLLTAQTLSNTINKKQLQRNIPVSLDEQAKKNIQRCWDENRSRLSIEKSGLKKEGDIYYQEFDRGWIITDGQHTFPVTGYILDKFIETGGIAKNGVPLEIETNSRLEGTNVNYQRFSKACFWGCGITILKVEQPFFEKLKVERPLENNKDCKCPTGTAPVAGSKGTVLLLPQKVMALLPGNAVIELNKSDKLYLKWAELGFINSPLGCPVKLEIQSEANSSKVISRTLRFEKGNIVHTYGNPDAVVVNRN